MTLPFTILEFTNVFSLYNTAVWPAQILIYLLAFVVVFLLVRKSKFSDKIISLILAILWLWMGYVYHLTFFSPINPVARIFGLLFIIQGFIFIFNGVIKNKISFNTSKVKFKIIGTVLMLLGMVIYPVMSYILGHYYPYTPTFGLPCPTTIFTFGVLLFSSKIPKYAALIPFMWTLIGFMAALSLGIKEDVTLLISGLIGFPSLLFRKFEVDQHKLHAVKSSQ